MTLPPRIITLEPGGVGFAVEVRPARLARLPHRLAGRRRRRPSLDFFLGGILLGAGRSKGFFLSQVDVRTPLLVVVRLVVDGA